MPSARHQIVPGGEHGVTFYVITRNTREYEKGTKLANICIAYPDYRRGTEDDDKWDTKARERAEAEARRRIIQQWPDVFGPIDWDLTRWKITNLTIQVVVEFAHDPL